MAGLRQIEIPEWELAESMPDNRAPEPPSLASQCDAYCNVTVSRINSWLKSGGSTSRVLILPALFQADFLANQCEPLVEAGFTITFEGDRMTISK